MQTRGYLALGRCAYPSPGAAAAAPLEVVEPAGGVGDEALRARRVSPLFLQQTGEPTVNHDATLISVVARGDDQVVRALDERAALAGRALDVGNGDPFVHGLESRANQVLTKAHTAVVVAAVAFRGHFRLLPQHLVAVVVPL